MRTIKYSWHQLKLAKQQYNIKSYMQRLENLNKQLQPKIQKFEYTNDQGCLTLQQRRFYEQNGYLVLKGFLKNDQIQRWSQRFLDYCDRKIKIDPYSGIQIIRDIAAVKNQNLQGQAAITKIQNFQFDEQFFTYCSNPDLLPYLKSFCGPNIKTVHTMFINKPPNMGGSSRHPFHQDLAYFPFRPANRIVAAWASLEDATKQNGSLNVFPGTHKGQFLEHIYPEWEGKVNKAYFGIKNYNSMKVERLDLEMKKGDIVLFHPLLIHGSGQNKTQGYRKSFCCHFADAACHFIDIKGTFHDSVAEEVMGFIKKKFPHLNTPEYTFQDGWSRKARLVTGEHQEGGI